jgi:ketosteroid isomerase-like protein
MKKILLLFTMAVFLSCETKVVEVPVKGGEIARGENKGSKFYIASDDNVDVVKKLLKAWNNMDPDGMFEVLTDTINWWVPNSKIPIKADKEFITAYLSGYDSIRQDPQGFIPHQWEGQEHVVVSLASREKKYKKDGTFEDDRLFERFHIKDGKIFRVQAWSADWYTDD